MAKFAKGNPGRPAGSRNAVNRILDQLAIDGAETLVKKMIEIAADGDRGAPARARCSPPEYFPLIKSVTSGNYRNILMRMMRSRFSSRELLGFRHLGSCSERPGCSEMCECDSHEDMGGEGRRRNLFERAL